MDVVEGTEPQNLPVENVETPPILSIEKKTEITERIEKALSGLLNENFTLASQKKESIKQVKWELHDVFCSINKLGEEIKEFHQQKEKEATIKPNKSESNIKNGKAASVNKPGTAKPDINIRSRTPIKGSSKPEERSKTPLNDKGKPPAKTDNKTPVRERPNREPNKSPINATKNSKSPIIAKPKQDTKNYTTVNIKTLEKKDKDKLGSSKKDVSINKSKTEKNLHNKIDKKDSKDIKDLSKATSEQPVQIDGACPKEEETKKSTEDNPEGIEIVKPDEIQESKVRLNFPKKVVTQEDSHLTGTNLLKGFILTMRLKFFKYSESLRIVSTIKGLESFFNEYKKSIARDLISAKETDLYRTKEFLAKYDNNPMIEGLLNKPFTPSKTALNSLNFIKEEEENNLQKNPQNDEVLNVIKFILILLNEPLQDIPNNKVVELLYSNIMQNRLKEPGMKLLILNRIIKNINLSSSQIEGMVKIISEYPKLLSSNELLKLNKVVSYCSFILKEIYDYSAAKTSDGDYLYQIRDSRKKVVELAEKVEELKKKL